MKLTPEQKAFFEYGKASEALKKRIAKVRHDARYVFGEPYCYLTCTEKKNLWITSDLKSYIQDYRQKRAACREINRGHICKECINLPTDKCKECKWEFHSTRRKTTKSLWKPRKEGE